jgi:hypothetical protein
MWEYGIGSVVSLHSVADNPVEAAPDAPSNPILEAENDSNSSSLNEEVDKVDFFKPNNMIRRFSHTGFTRANEESENALTPDAKVAQTPELYNIDYASDSDGSLNSRVFKAIQF